MSQQQARAAAQSLAETADGLEQTVAVFKTGYTEAA